MERLIHTAEHLHLDAVDEEENDEEDESRIDGLGVTVDFDNVGLELDDDAAQSMCICGKLETDEEKISWVECSKCAVWYHSKCVGYEGNANDISLDTRPNKRAKKDTKYYCPRCVERCRLCNNSGK